MKVTVLGAGVAGLTCAVELVERGIDVEIFDRAAAPGPVACSWYAGGMLAPWCELSSTEPLIAELGQYAVRWWREHHPGTVTNGSLVVAHRRDAVELTHFAARTREFDRLDNAAIRALEPDLDDRFAQALYFPGEAHLDPRAALLGLAQWLDKRGVAIQFGKDVAPVPSQDRCIVNCTGLSAREQLTDLRGVKGEMLLLHSREITLRRPIRILHPRLPLYIVPRGDGLFMVGATMIESDDTSGVAARSLLELLSAAYAVHPAFGEAHVVEIGTHARPAFPDNLPRIRWCEGVLHVNGLYRHGFLVAPALARAVAKVVLQRQCYPEVMDEDLGERQWA